MAEKMHRMLMATLCALIGAGATAEPIDAPCQAAEYRQYDAWLGEWDVASPTLGPIGQNRITAAADGCGLIEEWTGRDGSRGIGLMAYSAREGKWQQFWTDTRGKVSRSSGAEEQGRLVLEAEAAPAQGNRQRVVLQSLTDKTLRQTQEGSDDGGRTWVVQFEAIYRRR